MELETLSLDWLYSAPVMGNLSRFLSMNVFMAELIKMQENREVLLSFMAAQYTSVLHNINIKDFIPVVS